MLEAALLFCHPLLFMMDAFDLLLFSSSVPWPVINRNFPSRFLPVKRNFFPATDACCGGPTRGLRKAPRNCLSGNRRCINEARDCESELEKTHTGTGRTCS